MWMIRVLTLYCCFVFQVGAKKPPNILVIVADDLGWNDVSWNNKAMLTPNLQTLSESALILNNSYVQPVCTPSRSALLTGKYPYALGRQRGVLKGLTPTGLTQSVRLLPQLFQETGYATHMIGKWHLGYCNWSYTPTYRGFDTFYGHYNGAEDYYMHTRESSDNVGQNGFLDFRDNKDPFWKSQHNYSTHLFAARAEAIINSHNSSRPFFFYLPFQSVHAPLQVPAKYENLYSNIEDKNRRTYCGMVTAMDEAIGRIVNALKAAKLFEDTLIAFTTDNGGPWWLGGNNWPLRGGKASLWEGGTRGVSFVHYPKMINSGVYEGLFHITDWFPTLLEAANLNIPSGLNGMSQWKSLLSAPKAYPRKSLVYNLDNKEDGLTAAFRHGDYKLIIGNPGKGEWVPPPETKMGPARNVHKSQGKHRANKSFPNTDDLASDKNVNKKANLESINEHRGASVTHDKHFINKRSKNSSASQDKQDAASKDNSIPTKQDIQSSEAVVPSKKAPKTTRRTKLGKQSAAKKRSNKYNILKLIGSTTKIRLFNIKDDPEERHEISRSQPGIVRLLLKKVVKLLPDVVQPDTPSPDPAGDPTRFGNVWSPGWCSAGV